MALLTTTVITLRTGSVSLLEAIKNDGNHVEPSSGYARIVMLALE